MSVSLTKAYFIIGEHVEHVVDTMLGIAWSARTDWGGYPYTGDDSGAGDDAACRPRVEEQREWITGNMFAKVCDPVHSGVHDALDLGILVVNSLLVDVMR